MSNWTDDSFVDFCLKVLSPSQQLFEKLIHLDEMRLVSLLTDEQAKQHLMAPQQQPGDCILRPSISVHGRLAISLRTASDVVKYAVEIVQNPRSFCFQVLFGNQRIYLDSLGNLLALAGVQHVCYPSATTIGNYWMRQPLAACLTITPVAPTNNGYVSAGMPHLPQNQIIGGDHEEQTGDALHAT